LTTLISVLFGAVPGSFFGNGFETFLAENIIRYPEKTPMEFAVIGHLHIMLALICVMITLIIGRWLDFKGILNKIDMPLMILGDIVLSLGVWCVVTPLEPVAHMIIYVGATPSMLAALMLVSTTIQLGVHSRRREIRIMQLVGATNGFIRAPFIVEGAVQGLCGGSLAAVLLLVGYSYLYAQITANLTFVDLIYGPLFLTLSALGLVVCGVLFGIIGSLLGTRQYLKLI